MSDFPSSESEAKQRIWVLRSSTARHVGAQPVWRIERFTAPIGVSWSPAKVGATSYDEAKQALSAKMFGKGVVEPTTPVKTGFDSMSLVGVGRVTTGQENFQTRPQVPATTQVVEVPGEPAPQPVPPALPSPQKNSKALLWSAASIAVVALMGSIWYLRRKS